MFAFIQKNSQGTWAFGKLKVVRMDVFRFIEQCTENFDFILRVRLMRWRRSTSCRRWWQPELLKDKGWFVLEHTPRNNYEGYPLYVTQRNYGTTVFSIFVNKSLVMRPFSYGYWNGIGKTLVAAIVTEAWSLLLEASAGRIRRGDGHAMGSGSDSAIRGRALPRNIQTSACLLPAYCRPSGRNYHQPG